MGAPGFYARTGGDRALASGRRRLRRKLPADERRQRITAVKLIRVGRQAGWAGSRVKVEGAADPRRPVAQRGLDGSLRNEHGWKGGVELCLLSSSHVQLGGVVEMHRC